MATATFQDVMVQLESFGLMDVLIPFLLIFTVVFAALRQTKILGDEKKFHVIIALAMAFAVVVPHVLGKYPAGKDIVVIINQALPNVSVVLIAILMVLIILGIFGANINLAGSPVGGWMIVVAVVVVGIIFGNAAGWFQLPGWLNFMAEPTTRAFIIILLIFGVIIAFITSEQSEGEGAWRNIGHDLTRLFKK